MNDDLSSTLSIIPSSLRDLVVQRVRTLQQKCSGLIVTGVLSQNDKAALLTAQIGDNQEVVVKLCPKEGEWHSYFMHELEAYRTFQKNPPLFATPSPVLIDDEVMGIVIEKLNGVPLSVERFPSTPLRPEEVTRMLKLVEEINEYAPARAVSRDAVREYYYSRIRRYADLEILHLADIADFDGLLSSNRWSPVFCHGDPDPTNFLDCEGELAILDWELSDFLLPYSDHGLLWSFLVNDRRSQEQIEGACIKAGPLPYKYFLLNALLAVARSIRTHAETNATNPLRKNISPLREKLEQLREKLALL